MTSLDNTIPTRPLPQLKERPLPDACRPEAQALLQEIYGYAGFRELEVYDDLFRGKDTIRISQGQLIEHVLREAEKAREGEADVDNVLLTAPTGAGKSLLFQLPA
ncbi:MAG: ATP-dependent DNA helicase RecQ, partial [Candidatus Bacteroides intestinipullorum]|nr:ATP-dependent DNA helicase RecQ [Candidatus Bacteroides intestinipullorum]